MAEHLRQQKAQGLVLTLFRSELPASHSCVSCGYSQGYLPRIQKGAGSLVTDLWTLNLSVETRRIADGPLQQLRNRRG